MNIIDAPTNNQLLNIVNLTTQFYTTAGVINANKNISLSVAAGETLGVVGESGSGKSVMCRSILRLLPIPPAHIACGEIWFEGNNLLVSTENEIREKRGSSITMIFQDPMTSLNPVYRISDQIAESLRMHQKITHKQAYEIAIDLLRKVGIPCPEKRIDNYPHQLSGGMRQRIMIAMAISCKPKLLLADEPTTALDVTIQDQILALLLELQEKVGMSIILVSHDMGVVAETSDRVAVLYAGQVMEHGLTGDIFRNPKHPYTLGLMQSIPRMKGNNRRLVPIRGQPPNLLDLPKGCPFVVRCPVADIDICTNEEISLKEIDRNHLSACHFPERVAL